MYTVNWVIIKPGMKTELNGTNWDTPLSFCCSISSVIFAEHFDYHIISFNQYSNAI